MKCMKCGKGWPEVKVDVYNADIPEIRIALCDPCLFADIDPQPTAVGPTVDDWVAESNREALMLGEITLNDLLTPPF